MDACLLLHGGAEEIREVMWHRTRRRRRARQVPSQRWLSAESVYSEASEYTMGVNRFVVVDASPLSCDCTWSCMHRVGRKNENDRDTSQGLNP